MSSNINDQQEREILELRHSDDEMEDTNSDTSSVKSDTTVEDPPVQYHAFVPPTPSVPFNEWTYTDHQVSRLNEAWRNGETHLHEQIMLEYVPRAGRTFDDEIQFLESDEAFNALRYRINGAGMLEGRLDYGQDEQQEGDGDDEMANEVDHGMAVLQSAGKAILQETQEHWEEPDVPPHQWSRRPHTPGAIGGVCEACRILRYA